MKIAYFDAGSGISGDMVAGALLDAGAQLDSLRSALAYFDLDGYTLRLDRVERGGVAAAHFRVLLDEASPQPQRDWADVRALIERARAAGLRGPVADSALAIFGRLAEAEAKVHGVEVDRVHFHEVGAVDSIVDIVAAAFCLDQLGIEACFCGPLPSGSGYVRSAHGRLPVPAPATVELLAGFELVAGEGKGELVTPTGAAIIAATAKPLRPSLLLEAHGCGAGTRELDDRPNVLRVFIGEAEDDGDEELVSIEADIDDMTPEALAYAADRLRAAGARDVTVAPIQMKKGRLGMRLGVLAELSHLEGLAALVLSETTTIGLRYRSLRRMVLARRSEVVHTAYGRIAVKIVCRPDGAETAAPEFADVAAAAAGSGHSFSEVYEAALKKVRLSS